MLMKCKVFIIALVMLINLGCASNKDLEGITIYYYGVNATKDFHRDYPNLHFLYQLYRCDDPNYGYHHVYLIPDGRVIKVTYKGGQVWKAFVRQPYPHEKAGAYSIKHTLYITEGYKEIIQGTETIHYDERLSFDLSSHQGSSCFIMAAVRSVLIQQKCPPEEIDEYINKCQSGNYDNLLQVSKDTLDRHHVEYRFYGGHD